MPELSVGQAFLSKFGHMADAASCVTSDVINGPKNGFRLGGALRIKRG
jgi:hypothetical protein